MNKEPTIKVYFRWISCETDPRPYKPGKPVLEPVDVLVEVNVPIIADYISNSKEILAAQLTNQNVPKYILTPQGMKYCITILERTMDDVEERDDFTEDTLNDSNIDWEK